MKWLTGMLLLSAIFYSQRSTANDFVWQKPITIIDLIVKDCRENSSHFELSICVIKLKKCMDSLDKDRVNYQMTDTERAIEIFQQCSMMESGFK